MNHVVARRRLFVALTNGTAGPVTLVSGPAGSGKTVLVASWLRDAPWAGPVAWVPVERGEGDPARLWNAVLGALRSGGALPQRSRVEQLIAAPGGWQDRLVERLAERLSSLPAPALLVLDDVEHLQAPALRALSALVAHTPEQLRIVLISRREPRTALHRLRLSGGLAEIGRADLQFSDVEAGALLADTAVMLSPASVTRLNARTEGWAAGLRLAALAASHRDDPDRFVEDFSGRQRTIAQYLVTEVLAEQTPAVRHLLSSTCVLERVNGSLARTLSARADAERLLRELEEANAFVLSVDADRTWFRYHHLLSDVLRMDLRSEAPDEFQSQHRAAARWHAENRLIIDAIRHAEAGQEWLYARDLLMDEWFNLFLDGERATLHRLLGALPAPLLRSDPELAALAAIDRLASGRLGDADASLAQARRLGDAVRESRRERFSVTLSIAELMRARSRGNLEAAVERARSMLEPRGTVPGDALRALTLMNLGVAEVRAFRLQDAERHLEQGVALARRIGRPYLVIGCLGAWAEVAAWMGHVGLALDRSGDAIRLADRLGWSEDATVAAAYVIHGANLVMRGHLTEGQTWLTRAEAVVHGRPDPEASVYLPFVLGWLRFAQGRYEEAVRHMRAVERATENLEKVPFLSDFAAMWELRARILLGDAGPARRALADAGDAAGRSAEWCSLGAHLCLADGDPEAAVAALAPVFAGAALSIGATLQIEALLLAAVARDRLADPAASERAVERALDLAAPEGLVSIFMMVPGARALLERHPRTSTSHGAFLGEIVLCFASLDGPGARAGGRASAVALTPREHTVLGYLPTNLSAAAIAAELECSVHTVKTHMRTLYAKLGVHRRADAVAGGRALGLLAPSHRSARDT